MLRFVAMGKETWTLKYFRDFWFHKRCKLLENYFRIPRQRSIEGSLITSKAFIDWSRRRETGDVLFLRYSATKILLSIALAIVS